MAFPTACGFTPVPPSDAEDTFKYDESYDKVEHKPPAPSSTTYNTFDPRIQKMRTSGDAPSPRSPHRLVQAQRQDENRLQHAINANVLRQIADQGVGLRSHSVPASIRLSMILSLVDDALRGSTWTQEEIDTWIESAQNDWTIVNGATTTRQQTKQISVLQQSLNSMEQVLSETRLALIDLRKHADRPDPPVVPPLGGGAREASFGFGYTAGPPHPHGLPKPMAAGTAL